jgi:predicted DNA-binding transcriptional regulator AlpA
MPSNNDDPQKLLPPWREPTKERIVSENQPKFTEPTKAPRAQKPVVTDASGVAEMVACDVGKVWRLQEEGRMPAPILVGGEERWRIAEIKHWIQEGCPDRRTWERRFYRR